MSTKELKNQANRLWNLFKSHGITNPFNIVEQIGYLLLIRKLDKLQEEKDLSYAFDVYGEDLYYEKVFFTEEQVSLRWHKFIHMNPQRMYDLFVRPAKNLPCVFEHMKDIGIKTGIFSYHIQDASFMIPTPSLLSQAVHLIDRIAIDENDGLYNLYECLLSKIASTSKSTDIYTPRHIIDMIIEIVLPQDNDMVCDPCCGTAGFLVSCSNYLNKRNSFNFFYNDFKNYIGIEFDRTIARIASINLLLSDIHKPNLVENDAFIEAHNLCGRYSLVITNPPFKGSINSDNVGYSEWNAVRTKRIELLFLQVIIHILQIGGRCAVIVSDSTLSVSSKAHQQIRQQIVEKQKLKAVISLPKKIFGRKASILIFIKTDYGGTDKVWFYDMKFDGIKNKRHKTTQSDIPDIIARYRSLSEEMNRSRSDQSFMVPFDEIQANEWRLDITSYQKIDENKQPTNKQNNLELDIHKEKAIHSQNNRRKKVFVAMPFNIDFWPVWVAIKSACEKSNTEPCRVDQLPQIENIYTTIIKEIDSSDIIIGDFSPDTSKHLHPNPNVVTEMTHAKVSKKPIIIISQKVETLSFDWKQYRCLVYKNNEKHLKFLENVLIENLQGILKRI